MTAHYHINIFWSEKDDCWIADVPDLPACAFRGATPEEAIADIEEAMSAWIETAAKEGRPIPEPSYQPEPYDASAEL